MLATHRSRGKSAHADTPSPKEIRRACERIQAAWTPRERHKRAGLPRGNYWTPPNVRLSAINEAADDDWSDRFPYSSDLVRESEW